MADIFISHIEENADVAQSLAGMLESAGFTTWYYERDSVPGPSYLVQVSQAIDTCRVFALLVSVKAIRMPGQVTKEVVRAHEAGKIFLIVLIDVSHTEFQAQQPEWRMAAGASTSVTLSTLGTKGVVDALIMGLHQLGIMPGGVCMRSAGEDACNTTQSKKIDASSTEQRFGDNKAYQAPKANAFEFRLLTLAQLHDLGWSTEQFIEVLIGMDYDNLSGASEQDVGQTGTWKPIVENNPDGIVSVLNEYGNIIAYWHFLPLDDESYDKAKRGILDDGLIRMDNLNIIGPPGEYNMYFMVICIHPHYRGVKVLRMLFDAFVDNLIFLARQDIFFPEMCAMAFTPEGEALCKTLRMHHIAMHARKGKIFHLDMRDLPASLFYRHELLNLYANRYGIR